MRTFKLGQIIWHGSRYWKTDSLIDDEILGWNTKYVPYKIARITPKQILVYHSESDTVVYLNRQTMERDGKQYHTRFHEYFYAVKPPPEKDFHFHRMPTFRADCFITLGLSHPCTQAEVRRAYKRLAKTAHPDLGGSHQSFINLKQAHDSALRLVTY